jgi:phenylacetate-coenzyme A ligase PaaK-like adenylate-forming protein
LGVLAGSRCSCGRTLQVVEEFTGRTGEVLVTSDGRMIAPNFWCRTFMDPKLGSKIQRFQVIYRPGDRIAIRIVRGPGFTEATEAHLRSTVTRNLFASARLEFEYPERIDAQLSGKYQMVVKELS